MNVCKESDNKEIDIRGSTKKEEATVGLVVPSMIQVQSSCRWSAFLMCLMKTHSVLAAASFTGNTYCWGKRWERGKGGEEGNRGINKTQETSGPGFSPPLQLHIMCPGRRVRTKLEHMHVNGLAHDGTHSQEYGCDNTHI